MPPKREAGATASSQPSVKMIKISTDTQEAGGDSVEDKYRMAEDLSYSPFLNNEVRDFYLLQKNKVV